MSASEMMLAVLIVAVAHVPVLWIWGRLARANDVLPADPCANEPEPDMGWTLPMGEEWHERRGQSVDRRRDRGW